MYVGDTHTSIELTRSRCHLPHRQAALVERSRLAVSIFVKLSYTIETTVSFFYLLVSISLDPLLPPSLSVFGMISSSPLSLLAPCLFHMSLRLPASRSVTCHCWSPLERSRLHSFWKMAAGIHPPCFTYSQMCLLSSHCSITLHPH